MVLTILVYLDLVKFTRNYYRLQDLGKALLQERFGTLVCFKIILKLTKKII